MTNTRHWQPALITWERKPPKPPAVVFNNRLLLQLSALKEEKGRTWAEIQQLFVRPFPDEDFPPAVPLIRSAVQQFSRTTHNQQHFLQYDRDVCYVGPFTKEAGVTRSALTKENLHTCVSLTNGLVSELAYFAAKQGFKNDVLFQVDLSVVRGSFFMHGFSFTGHHCIKNKVEGTSFKEETE